MRIAYWMLAAGLLIAAGGCGSKTKYAPVSGVVTLDGKPYGEAVVTFQPLATKERPDPGRGSSGETDTNGRFVLKSDDMQNGAVVGKHVVRIWTRGTGVISGYDPSVGTPESGAAPPAPKGKIDPIPTEWSGQSDKEFDVPPGGTDKANFDIVTKKK